MKRAILLCMLAVLFPIAEAPAATYFPLDHTTFSQAGAVAYRLDVAQAGRIHVWFEVDDSRWVARATGAWLIDSQGSLEYLSRGFGRWYGADLYAETPATGVIIDEREDLVMGPGASGIDFAISPGRHTLVLAAGVEGTLEVGGFDVTATTGVSLVSKTIGRALMATGRHFSGGINAVAGYSFVRAGAVAAASQSFDAGATTYAWFHHYDTIDPYTGGAVPSALMSYRDPAGVEHTGKSDYVIAGGEPGRYRFDLTATDRGIFLDDTVLVVADIAA